MKQVPAFALGLTHCHLQNVSFFLLKLPFTFTVVFSNFWIRWLNSTFSFHYFLYFLLSLLSQIYILFGFQMCILPYDCNVRDSHSIPGSGRSPGEGNGKPPLYSCLENPMDRETWEVQSMELQKLSDWVNYDIIDLFERHVIFRLAISILNLIQN